MSDNATFVDNTEDRSTPIHHRHIHGDNHFSHSVMSTAAPATTEQNGPIDKRWHQVSSSIPSGFLGRLFHVNAPNARFTIGRMSSNSQIRGGLVPRETGFAVVANLALGSQEQITTMVTFRSSRPAKAFNITGLDDRSVDREVWTSSGWVAIPYDNPEIIKGVFGGAVSHDGHYWYRLRTDRSGITGFTFVCEEQMTLEVFSIRLNELHHRMEVKAETPALHIALLSSPDESRFPSGVSMQITDPHGKKYLEEEVSDTLFVKMHGASLWHLVCLNPEPGVWNIKVNAPEGVRFLQLYQTTPSADVITTIQKALSQIYDKDYLQIIGMEEGALVAGTCAYCVIGFSLSACLFGAAFIAGAALVGGPVVPAIVALTSLTATQVIALGAAVTGGVLLISRYLCYLEGACTPTEAERKRSQMMLDQTYRYDQFCYLTAHNAFSYRVLMRAVYAQQSYTIQQQLAEGIDAFMLDIWPYNPDGKEEDIYLCHGECSHWSRYLTTPGGKPRKLSEDLTPIAEALKANSQRIITIILECRVGQRPTQVLKAFEDAGAKPYIFYADRVNQGTHGTWDVRTQGWPTRKWMIDNNLRLVVLSDRAAEINCGGYPCTPKDDDGMPYLWNVSVESVYGDDSLNQSITKERKGSAPLNDTSKSLFILNRFPTWSVGGVIPQLRYNAINDYRGIKEQVDRYTKKAGRLPNFLAVDYFQYGIIGGAKQALKDINQGWHKVWVPDSGKEDITSQS